MVHNVGGVVKLGCGTIRAKQGQENVGIRFVRE
jgi:hypothetical protein